MPFLYAKLCSTEIRKMNLDKKKSTVPTKIQAIISPFDCSERNRNAVWLLK
jgi:hypothetical protein